MPRRLYLLAFVLLTALPGLASPSKPLVFEISFPKELSSSSVDGRVLLIISKNDKQDPRLEGSGISEGLESQQAFGVDVETWQPGTIARVDASTLGYPLESLRDLPPGDYIVQAVLNLYETFHLGNGKLNLEISSLSCRNCISILQPREPFRLLSTTRSRRWTRNSRRSNP
jgi:hypothetical protein